jgi:hypothetical protein
MRIKLAHKIAVLERIAQNNQLPEPIACVVLPELDSPERDLAQARIAALEAAGKEVVVLEEVDCRIGNES